MSGDKKCSRCPLSDMGKMPEGGCHGTQEWVEGLVTDSCPVMYTNDYSFLLTSFVWAERGLLPFAGGWAEQPANLIDGLDIVFAESAELQQRRVAANSRQETQEAQEVE